MLLVAEIILTTFAWRKGWKWLALLPIGIGLLIGFFMGFGVGASGGNVDSIKGVSFVLDVIVVIVLIVMNVVGPKSKENMDNINTPKL